MMKQNTGHTIRNRAIALAACGALALSLGASTAFASSGAEDVAPAASAPDVHLSYMAQSTGLADDGGAFLTRLAVRQNEDGTVEYSTDGGETWTQTPPDGMRVQFAQDGSLSIAHGAIPGPDRMPQFGGLMVRDIDGVVEYSTDGETWSTTPPEDVMTTVDRDGDVLFTEAMPALPGLEGLEGVGQGIMIRCENGAFSHSIDGGRTWIDGLPEGAEGLSVPGTPALQPTKLGAKPI